MFQIIVPTVNSELLRRAIILVLLTDFHLPGVVPEFQPELWSPSLGRVEYPPILDQTLQPEATLDSWLVFRIFNCTFRYVHKINVFCNGNGFDRNDDGKKESKVAPKVRLDVGPS